MEIQTEIRGETAHIAASGMMDTLNSEAFQRAVLALKGEPIKNITLDLSATDYICSSGLRALLLAKQIAERAGGEAVIQSPSPFVMNVLQTVGFVSVFKII